MSLEDLTAHRSLLLHALRSYPGLRFHPTQDPLHVTLSRTCSRCSRTWSCSSPISVPLLLTYLSSPPSSKLLRLPIDSETSIILRTSVCSLCLDSLSHEPLTPFSSHPHPETHP